MITPLRSRIGVAVFTLALSSPALAQSSLQSTPAPTVTAENEPWYLSGGPVAYGGSIYYPAGAAIHFVRDEMVPTGTFGNIPVLRPDHTRAGERHLCSPGRRRDAAL